MLFVSTGCDYISLFAGLGKASFLNAFYQYAPFICGSRLPGLLSEHGLGEQSNGYLVFLRLVGTTYFKKHLSAIYTVKGLDTPDQLFHSITTATTQKSTVGTADFNSYIYVGKGWTQDGS